MLAQLIGGFVVIILGVLLLLFMYWADTGITLCVLPLAVVFVGGFIVTDAVIDIIKSKAEEANSTTEVIYQEVVIDNKRYVLAEDVIVIDGKTYILTEDMNETEVE